MPYISWWIWTQVTFDNTKHKFIVINIANCGIIQQTEDVLIIKTAEVVHFTHLCQNENAGTTKCVCYYYDNRLNAMCVCVPILVLLFTFYNLLHMLLLMTWHLVLVTFFFLVIILIVTNSINAKKRVSCYAFWYRNHWTDFNEFWYR